MILIHTADWHLGQTFYDYDRRYEHLLFLDWLKKTIQMRHADLLLISGDLFDTPNPSADSQKIYYRFLKEVSQENKELQIIIVAGNHDSAARLEAPNPLLEEMNITVRGVVTRNSEGEIDYNHLIVPLKQGGLCLAVPYLRAGDYPQCANYADGVGEMYRILYDKAKDISNGPIIAMGHLQATGSEISENDRSEHTIIGGLECVKPSCFDSGIAYVALGHLHRAQRVSGKDNIRYSGAPIPMSFAEINNHQGVVCVNISDSNTHIEKIDFDSPVKLISIPKGEASLKEILDEISALPLGKKRDDSPYLEIKILLKQPEPSLRHQIEDALKDKSVRLAKIVAYTNSNTDTAQKTYSYEDLKALNPMDMALDTYKKRFGNEDMPEPIKILLQNIIREIQQ